MQEGKYVVLCVDDDADLLEALRLILEGGGYVALTATSAEEGLRKCRETDPDALIVDLMMEEVDAGTSLVKELRALGKGAPVFMLSSVGDSLASNINYSDLGLAGVFQKPVDPQSFLAMLRAKLG